MTEATADRESIPDRPTGFEAFLDGMTLVTPGCTTHTYRCRISLISTIPPDGNTSTGGDSKAKRASYGSTRP